MAQSKGDEAMTEKQMYAELEKLHDAEWIRKYKELVRLYKEAAPEQRQQAIDLLKKRNER